MGVKEILLDRAKRQGLAEGKAEGKAEGAQIERAKALQEKIEMAKALKELALTTADIAKGTGLSVAEIEDL